MSSLSEDNKLLSSPNRVSSISNSSKLAYGHTMTVSTYAYEIYWHFDIIEKDSENIFVFSKAEPLAQRRSGVRSN